MGCSAYLFLDSLYNSLCNSLQKRHKKEKNIIWIEGDDEPLLKAQNLIGEFLKK